MTEITPFFELLRKVFIVTGLLGAAEVLALFALFILMASESRIRDRRRDRKRGVGADED